MANKYLQAVSGSNSNVTPQSTNRYINAVTNTKPLQQKQSIQPLQKKKYSFWEEVGRFGSQFADASKDILPSLKLGYANFMDVREENLRKNNEMMNKPVKPGSFVDKYNLGRLFPNYDESKKKMDQMKKVQMTKDEERRKKQLESNKKLKDSAYKELSKNQEERAKKFGVREGAGGIADDVAASAPSLVTSVGLALTAGIVTKNPQVALALGFSSSYAQGSSEIYKQARDFGVDDKRATEFAHNGGIVMGALDTIPVGRLISKLPAGDAIKKKIQSNVLKKMMSVGIQGGLESGTEVSQTILQNAIAQTYNENQELFEGVDRTAISAFILGGGADVATSGIAKVVEKVSKQPQSSEEALQMATEKISQIVNKEKRTPQEEEIYETVGQAAEKESLFGENSGEELISTASKYKDAESFAQEEFGTSKDAQIGFLQDIQIRVQAKIDPFKAQQYLNEISREQEIEPVKVRKDGNLFTTDGEDYKVAAFRILKKPVPVIYEGEKLGGGFKTIEELFNTVGGKIKGRKNFTYKSKLKVPEEYNSETEKKAFEKLMNDPEALVSEYRKRFGNTANTDDAMELFRGEDGYKDLNSEEITRAASKVSFLAFEDILEESAKSENPHMAATMGGAGSGKTEARLQFLSDKEYTAINDSTGARFKFFKENIDKALESGHEVDVVFIYRDPFQAWENGVLNRPRHVGIEAHVNDHADAHKAFLQVVDEYADREGVNLVAIDNNYGKGEAKLLDLEKVREISYNKEELRKKIYDTNEQHYKSKDKQYLTEKRYQKLQSERKSYENSSNFQQSTETKQEDKLETPQDITAELPNDSREKSYENAFSTVMDAISSGDLDAAKALRESFLSEDKISLPSVEEMVDTLNEAQNAALDEIEQEIEQARDSGNPDDPTNKLMEIAGKIRANALSLTGKSERTVSNEAGSVILGGKASDLYDRLIQNTDIVGFSKNIRVLHLSLDKEFTAIHNSIRSGDIDGADYERFKKQFTDEREKTTKRARPSVSPKDSTQQKKSKATKSSSKTSDTSKVIVVDPSRLSYNDGKEGDISRSYSSDTVPNQKIRRPFTHNGKKYVSLSSAKDGVEAYELVPLADYKGETFTYGNRDMDKARESGKFYEGMKVKSGSTEYVLSNPLEFVSKKPEAPAYTGGKEGQSKGEFAELPNMTKEQAKSQKKGDIPEVKPTFTPFPEIVRLVKDITGKYPTIRKKMNVAGAAKASDMSIQLNAKIFDNVDQAAKVLSHELGHIMDYLPEKMRRKGNLLSRIASLNNYLKHTLKEFPDSTLGELTKKDRENIRKRAKQLSKQETIVTEDVVVGERPITVDEIKAIWNDVMSTWNDTELLTYVKSLDDKQKAVLVKAAMKGTVPEWVTFKRQIKETITHKVIKNAPADIKALYNKMLKEEVLARRLFELSVVKKELNDLSMKWKPYSTKWSSPQYIAYRRSSKELYADAISVLFNDPAMLKSEAPEFWRGFFNYVDQKPEVKAEVFAVWDMLNQSEDVKLQQRLDDIYEGFAVAKEKRKAIELEQPVKRKFMEKFMKQHITVFDPIYRKLKPKFKEHGLEMSPATETRMQLEEMQMRRNESYLYLDKVNREVIQPLETLGMTEDDLGVLLKLERNLGDRKDIANPYGLQGEYAEETLQYFREYLQKNRNITEEQLGILQQSAKKFRDMMFQRVEGAVKWQLYSKEFFEKTALPNKDTYVTYQVVDYIHDNYVSAGIKQAVGTLKEVENPVVSSLLKTLAVIEQTEIQKGKIKVVNDLRHNFAEDISEAEEIKPKGVRVGWKPVKDREVLEMFVDGKVRGFQVDPYIKEMFDMYTGTELHSIARVSGKFNQFFKPVVTTYNLSWGFFSNISRDTRRTYKNLSTLMPKVGKGKNISIAEFVKTWVTSIPEGYRFQRGKITPELEAMLQNKAFTTPFTSFDPTANEESSLAPILRKYNFLPDLDSTDPQWKKTLMKYTTPIRLVLRGIEFAGSTLETTTKVAGYQMVSKRVDNAQFAGYIVRNYVGTPNFMDGGSQKQVDNNVFVFSNVMFQAVRADLELATSPQTRSGYLMKTLLIDILPKIAMLAVAAGLLGDELKDQMDKATEYDKTNFIIIPFGTRENGKANYFRLPQDETGRLFSAMVWKLGQFANGDLKKPEQIISLGAGYIPSVTPLWTIAEGWLNYVQGRNPYDDYRGRLVIDDTTWKAGGLPVFEKMLQWTTNEAGLSQFSTYSEETDTTLDVFLKGTPIINRMIKSTDYGLKEKENTLNKEIEQKKARQTLEEREVLKEYTAKGKKAESEEERNAIRKEFYHSIIGEPPYDSDEKAKRTRLKAKFDVAVLRGEVSREMDQLIDADTNDFKVELLREWKTKMPSSEYEKLIRTGRENKIISDDLKKKLKKEQLWYLISQ